MKYSSSLYLALIVVCFCITGCTSAVISKTQAVHNITTHEVFGYPFIVSNDWGKNNYYPGQHSRLIECPEKYKPRYLERKIPSGSLSYFLGFANKNKVAGACSDDLISYKHLYGMLYCKSTQTINEIEYFTLITSNLTDSFVERVSCEKAGI